MPQHSQRFWLAALIVAWAVDFLFWAKPAGISFLVFVLLTLAAGYFLTWNEKARAGRASFVLSGLVAVLAAVTVLRSEGFTRTLNSLLALGGLALLVMTFRSGGWMRFRMLDYLTAPFELLVVSMVRGASLRIFPAGEKGAVRQNLLRKAAPVLRGLLLALPVVILLGALLASADLVFAGQLNSLFKNFDLGRLPEYLFRLFYILVLAYVFAGLYLQAVLPTRWGAPASKSAPADPQVDVPGTPAPAEVKPYLPAAPAISKFLGAIEAFVVLGSVDLLFAFFVGVQFRYFFGGQANITAAGFTYSEYARRGFFELVLVAIISLLLYLGLNAVTRRERTVQARVFTGLSVLLVGLVWVILASAYQRLLLYEDAYGFTSLRTYTHIFIPWLGFLLLATILLQILRREALFGGLLLLTTFGFALTFGIMNIDGFIVQQNVARARAGAELDIQYLFGLSDDALPVMVREFNAPAQPQEVRDMLGTVLSCRIHSMAEEQPRPWQAYHLGQSIARQSLIGLDLSAYPVKIGPSGPEVTFGGQTLGCFQKQSMDY